MESLEDNRNLENRKKILFSIKLLFGFPVVGLVWTMLIYYFSDTESPNFRIAYWIGGIGSTLGILCILSKCAYSKIFKFWNILIRFFDTCITWITLPLFYYFLFTPFSIVLRFCGKAAMKKKDPTNNTFWKTVKPPSSIKQYFRQF